MKKFITLIISLVTVFVVFSTNISNVSASPPSLKTDSVFVWSSPQLANIASIWVSEYSRLNPDAKMGLKVGKEGEIPKFQEKPNYLGFFTSNSMPNNKYNPDWKMIVGRNVIVTITNSNNPLLNKIRQKGITPAKLTEVLKHSVSPTWGQLLDDNQLNSINLEYFAEQNVDACLSEFLKTDKENIHFSKVFERDELITKVLNNPYSIGFCRLTDILNAENQELISGISLMPIDLNSNEKVDYFEDIYSNSADLVRGIWIGKYPRALYQNIYAISSNKPTEETELDFLEWIITSGQHYLYSAGYSDLVFNERKSILQDLTESKAPLIDVETKTNQSAMFLIIFGIFFTIGFIFFLVLYFNREKKESGIKEEGREVPVFGEHTVKAPEGLFFDKSHTWAFMEKEGTVRIGIDDFLQHVTGAITKVKMKSPGDKIKKGDVFLSLIQNGKQLEITSPVTGTITDSNVDLHKESFKLNSSPYGEGWVYMIRSDNWLKEIKSLLLGEDYKSWLKNEFSRLKDFISFNIKSSSSVKMQVVLQDGGELKDNLMEEFGPQVWEEFQNEFINRRDKQ